MLSTGMLYVKANLVPNRTLHHAPKKMETYWNVDAELAPTRLFDILLGFYKDKAARILEENALLLSRWNRFCKSALTMRTTETTFFWS